MNCSFNADTNYKNSLIFNVLMCVIKYYNVKEN